MAGVKHGTAAAPETVQEEDEVLVEAGPGSRTAVLNRPKALNALNLSMIRRLKHLYSEWEADPAVHIIILKSNSRAFCAGGDVRLIHGLGLEGRLEECKAFFKEEYELNHLIGTLKKPHVSLINGACMGGGNGLAMHGAFRVVTENAVFAMPETNIGLHPDVGASYFLPHHLPWPWGLYLGLTGARLTAADMTGLATRAVPSERLPSLESRLGCLMTSDWEAIDLAIAEHAEETVPGEELQKSWRAVADVLGPITTPTLQSSSPSCTMESIVSALESHEKSKGDHSAWCSSTLSKLRQMSPTSLKVTLRSLLEGHRTPSLSACLKKEFRITARVIEGSGSRDYYEGVRALLVDKDRNPQWNPGSLEGVTDGSVQAHFEPFADPAEELQLPVERERSSYIARKKMLARPKL